MTGVFVYVRKTSSWTDAELKEAISAGKKANKRSLKKIREELELQTSKLDEANTALNVLMQQKIEDKTEFEKTVLLNAKELIEPFLEKLNKSKFEWDCCAVGARIFQNKFETHSRGNSGNKSC